MQLKSTLNSCSFDKIRRTSPKKTSKIVFTIPSYVGNSPIYHEIKIIYKKNAIFKSSLNRNKEYEFPDLTPSITQVLNTFLGSRDMPSRPHKSKF